MKKRRRKNFEVGYQEYWKENKDWKKKEKNKVTWFSEEQATEPDSDEENRRDRETKILFKGERKGFYKLPDGTNPIGYTPSRVIYTLCLPP